MARQAHYSVTALSEAAGGETLPSWPVARAYVQACGGNPDEWVNRWQTAAEAPDAAGPEGGAGPAEEPAPYRGLAVFQPEDADWYFGRERLVGELITRLDADPFLAVFGASGSGKSSLLRAGLLPAVWDGALPESDDWPTVLMTPGQHPLAELAVQIAARQGISPGSLHADLATEPGTLELALRQELVARSPKARALLIVDQFEELFTLSADQAERAGFVAAVLGAAASSTDRVRVVLGIRADFYGRCADYPDLVAALRDHQILIGPMSSAELRRAVVEPANRAGLRVEPALSSTIMADVHGRPGALPLLSHALLETWRRRRGNTLTLDGYHAAGGVRGAIAQTAEQTYRALSPQQQRIAQHAFVRLTALGESTEDTGRRADPTELITGSDRAEVRQVLDRLAAARLLTLDADCVQVAHEALIREWPRLRGWLTDDRDSVRIHRRLTEAAIEWQANKQDEGFLYRGARLAVWQDRPVDALNQLERTFLAASRQRVTREHAARRRRARLSVGGLSLALIVISALALLSVAQRNEAQDQRDAALSRQLATSSATQLSLDPELSLLLARQAFAIKPTPEAESAVRQAVVESRVRATLRGHAGKVAAVAYSRDGRVVTGDQEGTIRIWDDPTGTPLRRSLRGNDGPINGLGFSPDGQRLASAGYDGTIRIWNLASSTQVAVLRGHDGPVDSVGFGPDGQRLASAGYDGTIRIWDLANSTQVAVLRGHDGPVNSVGFGPDGQRLASAGRDGTIRIWDLPSSTQVAVLRGHSDSVNAVAFSPDGRQLASASSDETVQTWTAAEAEGNTAVLRDHDGPVLGVAFGPDGRHVASAGSDGTIRIWDPTVQTTPTVLRGHDGPVLSVAFGPDGRYLASAGVDGTARVWEWAREDLTLRGTPGSVGGVAISPDGQLIASGHEDGTVRIWNLRRDTPPRVLVGHTGPVNELAFSPDGQRLVTGGHDGSIRIWDLSGDPPQIRDSNVGPVFSVTFHPDGQRIVGAGKDGTVWIWDARGGSRELAGPGGGVFGVAVSPDGRLLAAAAQQAIRIWDLTSDAKPTDLRGHVGAALGVTFAPDGRRLISAGNDGTVRIWDPANPAEPVVLRGHAGPVFRVSVSPDGRLIASAGNDQTIRIWDMRRAGEPVVFHGHDNEVNAAIFTPDGQRVLSASDDGTVRVWSCEACGPIAEVLALAHRRSTRELTAAEHTMFLPPP